MQIEFNSVDDLAARLKQDAAQGLRRFGIDGQDGSGKTALSQTLAERLGWWIVPLDTLIVTRADAFLEHLDYDRLRGLLGADDGPVIVEGICLLEVTRRAGFTLDRHVYVKRMNAAGLWSDQDRCDFDEPAERVIEQEERDARVFAEWEGHTLGEHDLDLLKELIRYHGTFKPARRADYTFLRPESR